MQTTKQVVHISVHQSSKIFAIMYFLIALVAGIIAGVYFLLKGEVIGVSGALMYLGGVFLVAFLYLILTYLLFALSLWLYNWVAKSFGGMEFTLEDK